MATESPSTRRDRAGTPVPDNEAQRLAALRACRVLDTPPEPTFDGIVMLASQLCGTPTALVSLIDESRQWFKARVGLEVQETPREIAFCAHAIMESEPFIVEDARQDARFAENPLVIGEPYIRFYAGVPLVLEDGSAIGSLCVIDSVPRQLSAPQLAALKVLARQVTTEIGLRRKLASSAPPPHPSGMRMAPSTDATLEQETTRPGDRALGTERRMPVSIGSLVEDRYVVDALIGQGGMGVVAQARDLKADRTVALKFMLAQGLAQRDSVQRFVREAQILLKIDSPHVAHVFDVGNLPSGEPFIVMEYLAGEDLKARLERQGKLAATVVVQLGLQLCKALESAHALGVLHRDLKPANLFLTRAADGSEVLKVLDFGICKLLDTEDTVGPLTNDATIVGSPHYMSPEQMVTPSRIDARSDLWSVGVVLYELLLGRAPFAGHTLAEVCAQVLTHEPPRLSTLRGDIPRELSAIVTRCLSKHPAARYPSASQLARELARL